MAGRPAISTPVHVRLGELDTRVDVYAAHNGISRAEAIRRLLADALDRTASSDPIAELFSDCTDAAEIKDAIEAEECASLGGFETCPNYNVSLEVRAAKARGKWILTLADNDVMTDSGAVTYTHTIHATKRAAQSAYKTLIADLTHRHFNPSVGPLWEQGIDGDYIAGTSMPWRTSVPNATHTIAGADE